jgi:hypothetical protein
VDNLSTTAGVVAIASGAVAVVALGTSIWLGVALRKVKRAQRAVLGDDQKDLVAHAAHLQTSFEALAAYVEDATNHLDQRVAHAEQRLDGAISHRSLVRYDAYGEMSGRQSTSIALLDSTQSGVVLSSIHHRDHALLYAKQVYNGRGELELSPEEQEAVRLALQNPIAGASANGVPDNAVARGAGGAGAGGAGAGSETGSS